jgi:hypothetical protein
MHASGLFAATFTSLLVFIDGMQGVGSPLMIFFSCGHMDTGNIDPDHGSNPVNRNWNVTFPIGASTQLDI